MSWRLATAVSVALTWGGGVSAAEMIQLVPSGPPPALDIAKNFGSITRGEALKSLLEYVGPAFNQQVLRREMQKRFDEAMKTGWAESERLGQKGFVIRVRYRVTESVQPVYRLGEEDVVYVGTGPSAFDVCISERCDVQLTPGPPVGTSFAKDSGYVWIVPKGANGPSMLMYSAAQVHDAVKLTVFNEQLLRSRQQEARGAALDGYAKRLAEKAKATSDREPVLKLLGERDKAREQLGEVERTLAAERERARKASDAASMLNGLSAVLSLAASVAAANASTGLDIESLAGGKIPSKEALQDQLNKLSSESAGNVKSLEIKQKTLRDGATGVETKLIGIGIKYQMDTKGEGVFETPPLP